MSTYEHPADAIDDLDDSQLAGLAWLVAAAQSKRAGRTLADRNRITTTDSEGQTRIKLDCEINWTVGRQAVTGRGVGVNWSKLLPYIAAVCGATENHLRRAAAIYVAAESGQIGDVTWIDSSGQTQICEHSHRVLDRLHGRLAAVITSGVENGNNISKNLQSQVQYRPIRRFGTFTLNTLEVL